MDECFFMPELAKKIRMLRRFVQRLEPVIVRRADGVEYATYAYKLESATECTQSSLDLEKVVKLFGLNGYGDFWAYNPYPDDTVLRGKDAARWRMSTTSSVQDD
jgi:hypothetical protein